LKVKEREINQEVVDKASNFGCSSIVSKILAARVNEFDSNMVNIGPQCMVPASTMKDCTKAAERIAKAIIDKEKIVLFTDYDVDGCTSMAILKTALIDVFSVPTESLFCVTGNRKIDGYGLSDPLVSHIMGIKPGLVITADVGSSEAKNVESLSDIGIDVIVTDHHLIGDTFPDKALAVVNPRQLDCTYDGDLAGCGVAWLVMTEVCKTLNCSQDQKQQIYELLDFVALGTVADMVSLASPINRFFVKQGLVFMNKRIRPCWVPVDIKEIGVGSLGFQIGPRLNAISRMTGSPERGIDFLMSKDCATAKQTYAEITKANEQRKEIEIKMIDIARSHVDKAAHGFVIYDDRFDSGIQGVVCSKIVESYKKPTVMLAGPDSNGLLHGSCRSGRFLHIRDALQSISNNHPGLLVSFGGHAAAAGLRIKLEDLDKFTMAFSDAVVDQFKDIDTTFFHMTDGEIGCSISCDLIDEIERLAPFGMGFPGPSFCGEMTVDNCRMVGKNPVHLSLTLNRLKGIQFNAIKKSGDAMPVKSGDKVRVVYTLDKNTFNGNTTPQLMIQALDVI